MRRNSNYINGAIFLVLIAVMISCKKQNIPVKPEPSEFSAMLKGNSLFPASGGVDTIIVHGNTDGWWVTIPDNNWVVISKKYGSGEFKLPVTIKPNNTGSDRELSVQINPTFGLPPVAIQLKQSK